MQLIRKKIKHCEILQDLLARHEKICSCLHDYNFLFGKPGIRLAPPSCAA